MKYVVIKCGGSVMEQLPISFFESIVALKKRGDWAPIIVHGGGPIINRLLTQLNIKTHFIDGLRVTSEEVLEVVEMALSGAVNKQIVRKLHIAGGKSIGISGVDGCLIKAVPALNASLLGRVGEVEAINKEILESLSAGGWIPVISPLGIDEAGNHYNINGDVAAAAIASALSAKLVFISDIPGIRVQNENAARFLSIANRNEVESLITEGQITGGMIPKVRAALDGLVHGVSEVAILNGLSDDVLASFLAGKNVGTKIVEQGVVHHG